MTQDVAVLSMLRAAGKRGVHTFELRREYIGNPSQRIAELRDLGYEITTSPKERLNGDAWGVRYVLVGEPSQSQRASEASGRDLREQASPAPIPEQGVRLASAETSLFDAERFIPQHGAYDKEVA